MTTLAARNIFPTNRGYKVVLTHSVLPLMEMNTFSSNLLPTKQVMLNYMETINSKLPVQFKNRLPVLFKNKSNMSYTRKEIDAIVHDMETIEDDMKVLQANKHKLSKGSIKNTTILKKVLKVLRIISLALMVFAMFSNFIGATTIATVATTHATMPTFLATSDLAVEALSTATQSGGWAVLMEKIMQIVDYIMDGVIIFAGLSWMFGNRTKAIEQLIGSGVGYIIIRHYKDIKEFFALI